SAESTPGEYLAKSVTPASSNTSSHSTVRPAYRPGSAVNTTWAASEYTSGVRERSYIVVPPSAYCTAAVWMVVFGHRQVAGMLFCAPTPSAARLIPYLAIMYAGAAPNHFGDIFSGGDRLKILGSAEAFRCGSAFRVSRNV